MFVFWLIPLMFSFDCVHSPATQAQRLKEELEELTRRHSPLLDSLQSDIGSLKILIERGLSQQMAADELMLDVTAARDKVGIRRAQLLLMYNVGTGARTRADS